MMEETEEKGVHVILDSVAANVQRYLGMMRTFDTVAVVNLQGSPWATVDLAQLMARHLRFRVIDIQAKDLESRTLIIDEVEKHAWPNIVSGVFRPVEYQVFPLESAADVHRRMERNKDIEKIILHV